LNTKWRLLTLTENTVVRDSWKITSETGEIISYTQEDIDGINAAMTDDQMLRALWITAQSERRSFNNQ
jgi:hypothetical protein